MNTDTDHLGVKCIGRGEILIKGPTVEQNLDLCF